MKWTKRNITQLKKLWNEGMKTKEIATRMGRTKSSVAVRINTLQRLGSLPYRHADKRRGLDPKVKEAIKDMYKGYSTHEKPMGIYQFGMRKPVGEKGLTNTQKLIEDECDSIKAFLIRKNEAYGDSALTPIRIFSQSDAQEQLKVRIDDKLNRLMQGKATLEPDDDVIKDLIGYLVLLLIQMKD